MPWYRQPRSLFQSALDSIRDLTLSAAEEAVTSSCAFTTDSSQLKPNTLAFKHFQHLTQALLPHTIAYEVSQCMLQTLALFVKNTACLEYYSFFEHLKCKETAQQLIISSMYLGSHQLVMRGVPYFMKLIVCRNLPTLSELRILELHDTDDTEDHREEEIRELLLNSIGTLKELVMFTFQRYCNDAVVKALALNCNKLEYLDVTFSKDVTDASVQWIALFPKLNSLNIWDTFITRESAVQLLHSLRLLETYLTDHKGGLEKDFPDQLQLRKYSTSFFTKAKRLAMKCPYLNTIMISALGCDLLPLSTLNSLQHISLYCSAFVYIEKYLEVSGSNLISLGLHEVRGVDIKFITLCTKLKKLELICSTYYNHSIEVSYDYTSPHFQSLESLTIRRYNETNMEHFLLGYKNLKFLDLLDIGQKFDEVLVKAISSNCLLNLEVVNLQTSKFDKSIIEELISSCKNLKELLHNNELMISEDPYERLKSRLKNVDFDFEIDVCEGTSEDE